MTESEQPATPRPRPRPRPEQAPPSAEAPGPAPPATSVVAGPARGSWRSVLAVAVAGALIIAFTVLNVVLYLQRSDNSDVDVARSAALQAAQQRVPALLSYSYSTLDGYVANAPSNATGSFKKDFSQLVTSVIAPAARQQQITTKATVRAAGVVQAHTGSVVVLVLLNQLTTSKNDKNGRIDGSRVQVTMTKSGGTWLISQLTQI